MPRTADASALAREQRKAAIVTAASRVFARKGLAGTKIADIATEAGMSIGLIYRYFSGKDEVFALLVEQTMGGSAEAARQALAHGGSAWERLEWFTAQMLPYQYQQPECSLVVLHALTSDAVPAAVRQTVLEQNRVMFYTVQQLIAEGQDEGSVVRGNATHLAYVFLSAIYGLAASTAFVGDEPVEFPDVASVLLMLRADHA
jgi:AcrR family transcriptional regulator